MFSECNILEGWRQKPYCCALTCKWGKSGNVLLAKCSFENLRRRRGDEVVRGAAELKRVFFLQVEEA